MGSADVTRRALSLVSIDSITGWYAKTFAETTIDMIIVPKGYTVTYMGMGWHAKYAQTGFAADPVLVGDEVKDSNNIYYEVKSAEEFWWLNSFCFYMCELQKRSPFEAAQPATSGTWATVDDPRKRGKVWLDTYLLAANLTEDNGSTEASFITCFAGAPYPIEKVLLTKAVDVVFTVHDPQSMPLHGFKLSAYGYEESMLIEIFTINKTGITGTNLHHKARMELRRIQETYPTGSIRQFESEKPTSRDIGGGNTLYSSIFNLQYRRATD